VLHEPAFGDAFTQLPETLIVLRHGDESMGGHGNHVTAQSPLVSNLRVLARALHHEDRP
jgi:hypothetical protein